jgi:hypothetical protein
MLITVLETIDVPKLFQELSSWAIELGPIKNLPFGIGQHVPPVQMPGPESVEIIEGRFRETTWSGQELIRHEQYVLPDGGSAHWFYLPKNWDLAEASKLTELQESLEIKDVEGVQYVGYRDGELVIPDNQTLSRIQNLFGTVTVYKVGSI